MGRLQISMGFLVRGDAALCMVGAERADGARRFGWDEANNRPLEGAIAGSSATASLPSAPAASWRQRSQAAMSPTFAACVENSTRSFEASRRARKRSTIPRRTCAWPLGR